MLELMVAGGWLMIPIVLCSIIAVGIIVDRLWVLRVSRVSPKHLVRQVLEKYQRNEITSAYIRELRKHSPLGRILAAGLYNLKHDREVMKESIEDSGRQVVHELERYLNALGTIASISPLLGLLGTVFGMISVFGAITQNNALGDANALAGGIATALITTAAGLSVAIPSLMFYRYFQGQVNMLVLNMEDNALKMVEIIHGQREQDEPGAGGGK